MQIIYQTIPNVQGMAAMDAIALLENLKLKVVVEGNALGKVKAQSLPPGTSLQKHKSILLKLS